MKVILTKDVTHIGQQGDILEVKDGFGRNFLLPKGLARSVQESDMRAAIEQKTTRTQKAENRRALRERYKTELGKTVLVFHKKANEQGHLFASVSNEEISEALQRKGFSDIHQSHIKGAPLKAIGEHQILALFEGVEIPFIVRVDTL